jgi:hypothetical protein
MSALTEASRLYRIGRPSHSVWENPVWSKNSICLNPIMVAAERTIPGKAFQNDVTQRYTVHLTRNVFPQPFGAVEDITHGFMHVRVF